MKNMMMMMMMMMYVKGGYSFEIEFSKMNEHPLPFKIFHQGSSFCLIIQQKK